MAGFFIPPHLPPPPRGPPAGVFEDSTWPCPAPGRPPPLPFPLAGTPAHSISWCGRRGKGDPPPPSRQHGPPWITPRRQMGGGDRCISSTYPPPHPRAPPHRCLPAAQPLGSRPPRAPMGIAPPPRMGRCAPKATHIRGVLGSPGGGAASCWRWRRRATSRSGRSVRSTSACSGAPSCVCPAPGGGPRALMRSAAVLRRTRDYLLLQSGSLCRRHEARGFPTFLLPCISCGVSDVPDAPPRVKHNEKKSPVAFAVGKPLSRGHTPCPPPPGDEPPSHRPLAGRWRRGWRRSTRATRPSSTATSRSAAQRAAPPRPLRERDSTRSRMHFNPTSVPTDHNTDDHQGGERWSRVPGIWSAQPSLRPGNRRISNVD